MILAYLVLLAVVASLLTGGRLKYFIENSLRGIYLPILAFLVEAGCPFLVDRIAVPISQWLWIPVVLEYSLLALFCALNWKRIPTRLVAAGASLNFLVIAVYGFRMPVSPVVFDFPQMAAFAQRIQSGELFEYTLAEWGSPLLFLGDSLILPFMHTGLASIGDLFLGTGAGWLVFQLMRPDHPKKKSHVSSTT